MLGEDSVQRKTEQRCAYLYLMVFIWWTPCIWWVGKNW